MRGAEQAAAGTQAHHAGALAATPQLTLWDRQPVRGCEIQSAFWTPATPCFISVSGLCGTKATAAKQLNSNT